MTNVQKLLRNNRTALGAVRQRLGASDANDEGFDDEINNMSPDEILYAWSGWQLGYGDWWTEMKDIFDNLSVTE